MKVWSRGLGKMELSLNLSEYTVRRDGENIYIEGIITDPVYWDFRITMTAADLPGLLHIGANRTMAGLLIGNLSKVIGFFAGVVRRMFSGGRKQKDDKDISERKEP